MHPNYLTKINLILLISELRILLLFENKINILPCHKIFETIVDSSAQQHFFSSNLVRPFVDVVLGRPSASRNYLRCLSRKTSESDSLLSEMHSKTIVVIYYGHSSLTRPGSV